MNQAKEKQSRNELLEKQQFKDMKNKTIPKEVLDIIHDMAYRPFSAPFNNTGLSDMRNEILEKIKKYKRAKKRNIEYQEYINKLKDWYEQNKNTSDENN